MASAPGQPERQETYDGRVSDAAHKRDKVTQGTGLLPLDLNEEQLDATPVLGSADLLVIQGLTDDEDDAFAAALRP